MGAVKWKRGTVIFLFGDFGEGFKLQSRHIHIEEVSSIFKGASKSEPSISPSILPREPPKVAMVSIESASKLRLKKISEPDALELFRWLPTSETPAQSEPPNQGKLKIGSLVWVP